MEQSTAAQMQGASAYGYGSGYDPLLLKAIGDGFCDLSKQVGEVACSVGTKVGDAECNILKNAGDISHRESAHLSAVERDLQNRVHETRQILTQLIADKTDRVLDRVDRDTAEVKSQLYAFERMAAEKFCEVKTEGLKNTQAILDVLAKNKLDEKNEIIESLRHERSHDKYHHQFALQNQELNYIRQSINSIEQDQRFSSKTVTFGNGNKTGTSQNANQA